MPTELTPQALYIDAHPGIVWETLRSVGKGQLPGSKNRARLRGAWQHPARGVHLHGRLKVARHGGGGDLLPARSHHLYPR